MSKEISELIAGNDKFLITSHVNPDGDSIGSVLALNRYLKRLGKQSKIINCSHTPENYKFLDFDNEIIEFDEKEHITDINESNVIFVLDTNDYDRLKNMSEYVEKSGKIRVCIDHHLGFNPDKFEHFISDIESPATGEILYKFFKSSNNINIDKTIAEPLYTAIMTDTGSFRFPRTDSETHLIAAELIECGADPVDIYSKVYDSSSVGKIKLLTRFLNKMTFMMENKLVFAVLKNEDFTETDTDIMDTEGFSKHMLTIDTVRLAIIFTESKHGVKISFRSKDILPSNEIAAHFGGGGHLNAAGAYVYSPKLDEIVTEVLTVSKKYIN